MTTATMTASGRSLFDTVARLRVQYAKWVQYRETVAELRRHNEHELEDLGMNRADITRVARAATYGEMA
ncbi:DUF1127 domain-containing protein [Pontivivens ytuae]|nr:DUF1127 domain-containing protein [Pontivivens ytuae]